MKRKYFCIVNLALAAVLMLTGCGVGVVATSAVSSELEVENAKSALKQLDNAKGQTGSIAVERAIEAYRADKGVNPPSLEELVPDYLPKVPTKADGSSYDYDPATGEL